MMIRAQAMERVRLKHAVQTVAALEAVVLRAFGPHGGQVLFTRDTGQAMLSRGGARILTVLRLDNPLARVIVDCASTHSARTGDGAKTFILLLASFMRMIDAAACKDPPESLLYSSREDVQYASARHLANELLSFSLQQLDDLLSVQVLPYGQRLTWQDSESTSLIQKLLASFFHTRLGYNNCSFISRLLCELLFNWTFKDNTPFSSLQFLNDMWPVLYTPITGFPLAYSRLVEGQVIHRDFAVPLPLIQQKLIKAVVLDGHLHPKFLDAGEALEIRDNGDISSSFISFAERSLESVIAYLKSLGVSVLLSSVKQSAAVLASTAQSQIHVVECISQEELTLFRHLSGAKPVSNYWSIQPEHVVLLEFCKPILLGAHRYVHVGFPEKQTIKPKSLVICGAGEGQTEQHAAAMQDAIRMLLTTWQPPTSTKSQNNLLASSVSCCQMFSQGYVIAAGGTFEFLLSHALQQKTISGDVYIVSRILADSLLCVPQHIYSHHPRRFAQVQSEVLNSTQGHGTIPMHCQMNAQRQNSVHIKSASSTSDLGLESVFSKYQLLLAVLQCVSQLFRIDAVIHTRGRLKTISRTNISWEDSEDENEN